MSPAIVEATVLEPGRFRVKFADGVEGSVRFAPSAYRGGVCEIARSGSV